MVTNKPKHILIAPLDWGLGHTTRCVPIIRYIQSLGHVPVVAGNAAQCSFIKETFGTIDIIHLEGYNISYSKWNKWVQIGLMSQMPGIMRTIKAEHKWLQELLQKQQIDGIITDNRYGLYHNEIPSVILTHQLQVQTGIGAIADRAVQRVHYQYLERFSELWVADTPGTPNLGGKLSHTAHLPKHARYIGLLSQFKEMAARNEENTSLVILLSGPEPQRSELAGLLWQQIQGYKGQVIFIEGSNDAIPPHHIPPNITYHRRVAGKELTTILATANMVICRSGYSTLMDLVTAGKKAILIPTPGQTEQEYLGKHLHDAGIFYSAAQKGFSLERALNKTRTFPFHLPALKDCYQQYQPVLQQWLSTL